MNPPTCPTCSAPLEPLVPQCSYCGAVTESGRAAAARADYEARARDAQARASSLAQASMAQAIAADEVRRNARNSLIWTGAGMVLCCAPSGWVGGFFAWRSLSVAKKHGISGPISAYLSLVLAVLGTAVSITTCVAFKLDQAEKSDRRENAETRAEAGRKLATLDPKTACALVEAHMLSESPSMTTSAELSCKGPLTVTGNVARFANVIAMETSKSTTYRACFARSARWYVLNLDEEGECPTEAPKADTPADEKRVRTEFIKHRPGLVMKSLDERLKKAKDLVESASLSVDKPCGDALASTNGAVTRAIDFAVLDGKRDADFAFLSNSDLSVFLNRGASSTTTTRLASEFERSPLLVVYRHQTRSAPVVTVQTGAVALKLEEGEYEGAVFVVDTTQGTIACQSPLRWRGPTATTFRLSRDRTQSYGEQARATKAYRELFNDAATDRVKQMTGGRVKLGYKPLE